METESEFDRKLKELKCQLRTQKASLEELGIVLSHRADGVFRHDQAVSLDNFRAHIMEEVEDARTRETVAGGAFATDRFTTMATKFAVGIIGGLISGQKNPLLGGINSVKPVLGQKAPFGTVLVAIGKGGLPQDVKVVRLSRLARDSNRTEIEVRQSLRNSGYLLVTPKTFAALVDNLIHRVLDGSLSLPVAVDKIACELAGIIRKRRLPR